MLKLLDLFSGIGGFSYAANQFGIETVGFSEVDLFCSAVLKKHWPHVKNYGDIKKLNFYDHVDLITGGFPCQPFSVAGKKLGNQDDRYLWPEFYRVIKQCRPTWVIAENVVGIVAMELDSILNDLEKEGYQTRTFIIPACAANAPHRRDRVWIIANLDSKRCNGRADIWQKRSIQSDIERYITALQQKWKRFQHKSWSSFNAQDWLDSVTNTDSVTGQQACEESKPKQNSRQTWVGHTRQNRGYLSKIGRKEDKPPVPGVDDGLSHIVDRNRALGNAIVPQIAFVFIGMIFYIETGLWPI